MVIFTLLTIKRLIVRTKFVFFLFFLSVSTDYLYTQVQSYHRNFQLEWGEMNRFRGDVEQLFDIEMNSFSALVNRVPAINFFGANTRHLKIKNINNLNPALQGKITLTGNDKPVSLQGVLDIGDKLVAFSKQTLLFNRTNDLYYHKFNHFNLDENISGKLLGSYDRHNRYSNEFAMDFTHSLDQKKGAAFYVLPSAQHDYPSVGYLIFDRTLGLMREGLVLLPYRANEFEVYDEHLTNDGDYYVIGKHYYPFLSSKEKREYDQLELYKIEGNEAHKVNINQPELRMRDMEITSDDQGNLYCTGFYSGSVSTQITGVYFFKLEKESEEVINFTTSPITVDFLSTDEPEITDKFLLGGRFTSGRNDFGNFSYLDMKKTADGGFVAITENAELELRIKGSGESGNVNDRYDLYYYYNDIIVYKLDSLGKMDWVKRVPKYQQSINDNAVYLSASTIIANDKLYLLFNDHRKNYDENLMYKNMSFPRMSAISNRNNVLAIAEIDLKTGKSTRKSLPGRSELSTLFIPGLSRLNLKDHSLLIYSNHRNKHRFGKINFK